MNLYKSITELIGNTPMVKLKDSPNIFIKLEKFNPGGSIKDRVALNMIETAEKNGRLKSGGTIVEPTSGNTGIGLALVGRAKGYNVILTMPENMSKERKQILKTLGAKLVLTPGDKGMKGAIEKAGELIETNNNYYMPQQFENPANPETHRKSTAREILADTEGKIDYFICGVGTGGTLTGIGEVLKKEIPGVNIIAVEPENSAVISGEKAGSHNIQGIGAGFIPGVLNTEIVDKIIKISDTEAIKTTRMLNQNRGLLVGISSGAAVAASLQLADSINNDKTIVTIAPDNGERYLSIFEQ